MSLKFAIIGAGGVGAGYGARLWKAGYEVTFIARGAHLAAIKENGLKLLSDQLGDVLVKPAVATSNFSDVAPVDYVLLCVKLWDTEETARAMKPMIGENTAVMSLQNGIERDNILSNVLGEKHIIGGISYIGATITEPGIIQQRGNVQKIVYGEYNGEKTERVKLFQEACSKAGIEAVISEDIEKSLWIKFTYLVGMSASCAVTRQTIGPVRSNPRTREIMIDVMKEAIAVGKANGVKLEDDLIDQHIAYLDGLAPDVTASMQHDLAQGNRLELPWLSGAVVDLGKKLGVETPVNRVIRDVLSPFEMGTPVAVGKST